MPRRRLRDVEGSFLPPSSGCCLLLALAHAVAGSVDDGDLGVMEALSNSLMEAMGCGCCPVASRVGGNPELVTDAETGLLFPVGDADALADRLALLLDQPEYRRRLAARAQRRMREHFTREQAARAMGGIYQEFLARGA